MVPAWLRQRLALFFKGAAMGAADVVPGVSGGTIAFIAGIYEELLQSIRAVNLDAVRLVLRGNIAAAWRQINGTFLLVLFAGIITSIATLARLITHLLENHPVLVWSFFFGVILGSMIYIARQLSPWRINEWLALALGTLLALGVAIAPAVQAPTAPWMLLIAGAIAICAMILPGISGSFILLLMGMYPVVLDAINRVDVVLLGSFMVGCVIGLLAFSRVLTWLLARYHNPTLALLSGFLLGSLYLVWPWKRVVESIVDRHGELRPVVQENIAPWTYAQLNAVDSQWLPAALLALVGLLLVLGMEWYAWRHRHRQPGHL